MQHCLPGDSGVLELAGIQFLILKNIGILIVSFKYRLGKVANLDNIMPGMITLSLNVATPFVWHFEMRSDLAIISLNLATLFVWQATINV